MIAIILAAWEGSRLRPLSNTIPKPMIKIYWKTILEHNIEKIYSFVEEIIIVVKYKKEIIQDYFKNYYKNTKITYIEQNDEKWTAAAIRWINIPNKDILILNWDSIFDQKDLEKIINLKWYWALVKKVENPSKYWIFKQNSKWFALEIIEKPKNFVWNLANLWVYKFNEEIIEISKNISFSIRKEYEITDAINEFIKKYDFNLIEIGGKFLDISYPWNILDANKYFLDKLEKSQLKWTIEKWVTIKWNIILWKWSILKSWTYIEWNIYIWENTSIWPNTYLRWNSVIWDNCHIGNWVEIKNSNIWNKTNIAHLSYIWDSIIWNNVNIWWWMITANLRHDKWDICIIIKWEKINSKRHKFWVVIWDNTKTWIKTMTYPWRIIQNDSFTLPWEIIK